MMILTPHRRTRRPKRTDAVISLAVGGVALLTFAALSPSGPRLIWNATASAPIGLYWVRHASLNRDDLVLVSTPDFVKDLAAARGYLPLGVPLVKRIAAVSGDQICVQDNAILLNGTVVAERRNTDSVGRAMPLWSGCRTLAREVFLLMGDVPSSFDSRYFGPVPETAVLGLLTPLWIR